MPHASQAEGYAVRLPYKRGVGRVREMFREFWLRYAGFEAIISAKTEAVAPAWGTTSLRRSVLMISFQAGKRNSYKTTSPKNTGLASTYAYRLSTMPSGSRHIIIKKLKILLVNSILTISYNKTEDCTAVCWGPTCRKLKGATARFLSNH